MGTKLSKRRNDNYDKKEEPTPTFDSSLDSPSPSPRISTPPPRPLPIPPKIIPSPKIVVTLPPDDISVSSEDSDLIMNIQIDEDKCIFGPKVCGGSFTVGSEPANILARWATVVWHNLGENLFRNSLEHTAIRMLLVNQTD